MPQQTIDTGFEGCGSVRISYAVTTAPNNAPLLEDDEGRYVLVDRAEPTQALKVVVNHALGSDPYDLFFGTTIGTDTYEFYNPSTQQVETITNPTTTNAAGQGVYKRYEDVTSSNSTPDGGSSSQTNRLVYSDRVRIDYDEDWNPIQVVYESFAFSMPLSSQGQTPIEVDGGQLILNESSSHSGHSIRTSDFRSIDFETGEVSDAWSIVVYEVYEWGDNELARFNFDTDPNPITVKCIDSDCDEDCIPTYNAAGAVICVCRENGEPNEIDGYDYQPYHHNQTQPSLIELNP